MQENIDIVLPDLFGDFELDFDLGDFDLSGAEQDTQTRILKPRMDPETARTFRGFGTAEQFARQIDLTGKTRMFAWVSGAFIFGDIIEALWRERYVEPKDVYICTLSMSQENIDSLEGLLKYSGMERLYMLVSGYYYSHEKFNMVPYMYEHLDVGDKTQIAFGNYHGKIICIETQHGHTITIHGSANMRSSNNFEQVCVEVDQRDIFDFNAGIIREVCEKYGTINYLRPHRERDGETWQAVLQAEAAADGPSREQTRVSDRPGE